MLIGLPERGSVAPDWTLPSSADGVVRLADVLTRGHALLLFYPGNNTPG